MTPRTRARSLTSSRAKELTVSKPQKRKKRSVTLNKKLKKTKTQLEVRFDGLGCPIGTNAAQFRSYVGVETRKRISILISDWKKVPETEKDELWEIIKDYWDLDDTNRDDVLTICNTTWRSFKKRLIREFLRKDKDPVSVYPYLDASTWQEFIALKSTDEFKEKSEQGRVNAKLNTNPARVGACGYAGKKAQWRKELEAGTVSSDIAQMQNERAQAYLMGRRECIAPGVYRLPANLRSLADELIEKDRQLSQGEWEPEPGEDPVTAVLGPENPSHTRVVGHTVGLKKTLLRKRKGLTEEDISKMVEMIVDERLRGVIDELEDMKSLVQHLLSNIEDGSSELKKSRGDSASVIDDLDEIEIPTPCDLVLTCGRSKLQCAKGAVYPDGNGLVNSVPLLADHKKVRIDEVLAHFESMELPVPTEEMSTLVEAHNSFVQWPRSAIVLIGKGGRTPAAHERPSKESPVHRSASTLNLVQGSSSMSLAERRKKTTKKRKS